jgi:uncharacterized protein
VTERPAPGRVFLPGLHPIESYGKGGFRFAGLSHRGSLLCLPSGIWAWPVAVPDEISDATLAAVFAAAGDLKLLLIGAGRASWAIPEPLMRRFRESKLTVEVSRTGTAVTTYNILLGEGRPVAAGLIAVD